MDPAGLRMLMYTVSKYAHANGVLDLPGPRIILEGLLSQVRGLSDYFSGDLRFCKAGKRGAFYIESMIEFFRFSGLLKSSQHLEESLRRSLDVLLPASTAARLKCALGQGVARIPSASTLSRFRFAIDAGYMLWFRSYVQTLMAAGGIAVYMLADASPVAGREWLLAECFIVQEKDH